MKKIILIILAIPLVALVAGAQDVGNNCCNLPGRNCQTNGEWIAGYYEYVYHQCQPPAQSSPSSASGTSHQNQNRNAKGGPTQNWDAQGDQAPNQNRAAQGDQSTSTTPSASPVREMLDAAERGELPEDLTDEQESLNDMRRCSTRPWTRWHLHNCASTG